MLPTFKEVVEELFTDGLVKAVFATETLALGINMPARSVVLEKLAKWNGETHADVTPGEYTQLTGRAGRRGIDVEGHAVVLWQPGIDPRTVAGLASTRTYPLRSSFRPSYNMAVNLVGALGREQARALLESSFAQFQADASVVGLARQVTRNLEGLEGYRESMTCHLGDAEEYGRLRAELKRARGRPGPQRRGLAPGRGRASLEQLKPGDVVRVPSGRRAGARRRARPGRRHARRAPPAGRHRGPLGRPAVARRLPDRRSSRSAAAARAEGRQPPVAAGPARPRLRRCARSTCPVRCAAGGARAAADDDQLAALRAALRRHPVHGCDDREAHMRWAERWHRLRADTDALERRDRGQDVARSPAPSTGSARCSTRLGYLDGDDVTDAGPSLARVYSESDLLVVECLRAGLWDALSPAELAAVVSALVYTSRRADESNPRVPSGPVQTALTEMDRLWARLAELERESGVQFLSGPTTASPGRPGGGRRAPGSSRCSTTTPT